MMMGSSGNDLSSQGKEEKVPLSRASTIKGTAGFARKEKRGEEKKKKKKFRRFYMAAAAAELAKS